MIRARRAHRGAEGSKGDKGDTGSPGVSGYQIVTATGSVPAGGSTQTIAFCPSGKKVIGGGYASGQFPETQQSYPGNGGTTWDVSAKNVGNASSGLFVYAICATA